jgi:hypothetical protein
VDLGALAIFGIFGALLFGACYWPSRRTKRQP